MGPQEHAVHGSSNMVHVGAASAHAPVAGSPHAAVAAPQGVGATAAVRMDPWTRELICGVVAGATNVASGFPFDTVKVGVRLHAACMRALQLTCTFQQSCAEGCRVQHSLRCSQMFGFGAVICICIQPSAEQSSGTGARTCP